MMMDDIYNPACAEPNNKILIDFRSDTVTKPTSGMRKAISKAEVGDDVYGDDPTVNNLEEQVAELLGKEAGLFLNSGTQSNLCAMLAHCQRGEEILTGDTYHVFLNEAGGASVLGGAMMSPIKTQPDGSIDADDIDRNVKPDDPHCPISKLLSIENTVSGKVQSVEQINKLSKRAKKFGLSVHMDGARLFNATTKLNVSSSTMVESVDSVSLCLSKGLGAPAGSVLVGSREFIRRAYRVRKLLGGQLRQAGILAAAGKYALDNNIQRLEQDHLNALILAKKLKSIDKISVNMRDVQTNMVFATFPKNSFNELKRHLSKTGILIATENNFVRLVTHLDISRGKIETFYKCLKSFFS